MKRTIIILIILLGITAGCAVLSGGMSGTEAAGELFEGSAQGYRGQITVQVRLDKGAITEIVVTESQEDRLIGGAAIEELIDIVIENNNTDVDVVTGATISSKGFLDAVECALQLAQN